MYHSISINDKYFTILLGEYIDNKEKCFKVYLILLKLITINDYKLSILKNLLIKRILDFHILNDFIH